MLTDSEDAFIKEYAYVPEHITGYVTAVSGAEPFLIEDYLCYFINRSLTFVGYPLKEEFEDNVMAEILDAAFKRFNPEQTAIIAPSLPPKCIRKTSDSYYRLGLSGLRLDQKLRNTLKRANSELLIEKSRSMSCEHLSLISEFLDTHQVDEGTRYIFSKIPLYVSAVKTSSVFSARDKRGRLIAFDIADFGSKDYAFYMFNFISRHNYASGASDLLLNEVIADAKAEGKTSINLGLGINEGIRFFKKKWGGVPFINYEFCLYRPNRTGLLASLLKRF